MPQAETTTTQISDKSSDHQEIMLDIEKGKIVKELQQRSASSCEHQEMVGIDIEEEKFLKLQLQQQSRPSSSVKDSASKASDGSSFSPFSANTSGRSSGYHYKWLFTLVILLLGSVASALVMLFGISGEQASSNADFLHEAKQLTKVLESSWEAYVRMAGWVHLTCQDFDPVHHSNNSESISTILGFCSREKFHHHYEYVETLNFPFISIQFIPNITHSLRAKMEEESRAYMKTQNPEFNYSGIRDYLAYPNATFKEIVPAPARDYYFPIHYLEPLAMNENVMDIDMYSILKNEIDKAFETQKPVLGPRGILLQDDRPGVYGVSLIHPGHSTAVGLSQPRGVSKIVIRIPDLIDQTARATVTIPSAVYVYDETPDHTVMNNGDPIFLAAAEVRCCKSAECNETNPMTEILPEIPMADIPSARHSFATSIQAADHTWRVVIHGTEPNYNVTWQVFAALAIFVGCALLAIAFHINFSRVAKMHSIRSAAEREKAEMALLQARRETHLNDFIAHEVRNPLSSSIAALSFISATTHGKIDDQETRDALLSDIHILDSSLQYINDLLRNMLDIHRSASKKMKLDEQPTDILKDIFEPVQSILCVKQTTAKILIDCPEHLIVIVDRLRVKQIILNLAINSTKFVLSGFIRLRAQILPDGQVQLSVEDSGPGIRAEQRDRLFSKFQESFDLLSQGTGIGLHICKSLCELMEADLYLDDEYRSDWLDCPGARFVINLHKPALQNESFLGCASIKEDSTCSTTESSGHDVECAVSSCMMTSDSLPTSLSVLFVDDDIILRKMFARTVKRAAPTWLVTEASNGETALKLVDEHSFDIIFVDQYMASVEKQLLGTETVRALRRKGVCCVVCGLSANDLRDQFLDSGADAFMLKPFPCEVKRLQEELHTIVHSGRYNGVLPQGA
jgi:signal transduction histidine kinase